MTDQAPRRASSLVLYYPHATFLADNWVKLAVLAFDRVARIRPAGYPNPERGTILALLREMPEFIADLRPEWTDLDFAAGRFNEAISGLDAGTLEQYSFRSYPWSYRPAIWSYNIAPPWVTSTPGATYVWTPNEARMTGALQQRLISMQLARADNSENPTWLWMHPTLAEAYVALLAFSMAESNALTAATDDPVAHRAFGDASFGRIQRILDIDRAELYKPARPTSDELESCYMQLAIRAAIAPIDLSQLPIERLVEFRREHDDDLGRFRVHVESLRERIEQVAMIEGIAGARLHLEDLYRRETLPRVKDLQSRLKSRKIDTAVGLLSLKFETKEIGGTALGVAATTASASIASIAHPSAAATFGLVPVVAGLTIFSYIKRRREERRAQLAESPASYLLALGERW